MTTPSRFEELKPIFRKLVLAMRKATGIIHQQPDLARKYYYDYYIAHNNNNKSDNADDDDEKIQQAVMDATFTATLPAFPNDNSMSTEYYQNLMSWLIDTNQVDAKNASDVAVSTYWTNEVAM
eukprot:scaffold4239_cov80-Cylindrotheca_fusiformis.AAC.2